MSRKTPLVILHVVILVTVIILALHKNANITTPEEAVSAIQKKNKALADYPSDNLPIKRIQSESGDGGFYVGFATFGSGLPGILSAQCYFVSPQGEISSRGEFAANGSAGPHILNLKDCTAIVAENPEGEADPARMSLGMKTWIWTSALYNDGRTVAPKKAGFFRLTFADGRFTAQTDCNSMGGTYAAKNGMITFGPIMTTEMYCEGSQEQDFARLLENASEYHFTNRGELILGMKFDSGTAAFR
jgi:heat shock protein HslJ